MAASMLAMPVKRATNNALSHILQQQRLLTAEASASWQQAAQQAEVGLLHYLVSEKILNSEAIARACACYFGLAYRDLQSCQAVDVDEPILHKALQHYTFIAIEQQQQHLTIALSDPGALTQLDAINFQTHYDCCVVFAPYHQLMTLINQTNCHRLYQQQK